jgi:hypothetical protein
MFKCFVTFNTCLIDWSATGAMLSGIGTLTLIVVAIWQLTKISNISNADFIKRFNDSFFTPETRQLITLLSNSALKFEILYITNPNGVIIDRLPYLKIIKSITRQLIGAGLIQVEDWRNGYNAFEIDDLILGHLDDVGGFVKSGLIDLDNAYETFSYYVNDLLTKDSPLRSMLDDEDNEGNYDNVKYIMVKFSTYKTT